jgi:RNA polymerase sigma-70 factor (ECF subfamily)
VLTDEEREELERAYRAHGADLWRALFAYCGDARVAEDAVAEAFIRAGDAIARIRDLRAWLYVVAFRLVGAELRTRRRQAHFEPGPRDPVAPDDSGVRDLLALLSGLSPNQRRAFILRVVFGYPTEETATLLGISQTAVRVHLSGARRRLRGQIREVELT